MSRERLNVIVGHCRVFIALNAAASITGKVGTNIMAKLVHGPAADGSGALPKLEEVCANCDGDRFVPARREGSAIVSGGQCNTCGGAGTIKTEDGKRLLAFILRHA